jgi:hypothetical protein
MTQSVPACLSEHFICSAYFSLEQTDTGGKLTEEQWRDVKTFEDLDNSLDSVPLELIEQTIQLRARNPEAFENSVSAMCAAVCDTFRPLTAADFLQKVNEDIRSEFEFGKSKGRENSEIMREVEEMAAEFAAKDRAREEKVRKKVAVAAEN